MIPFILWLIVEVLSVALFIEVVDSSSELEEWGTRQDSLIYDCMMALSFMWCVVWGLMVFCISPIGESL